MEKDLIKEDDFSLELEEFIKEWKDKPGNLIMVLHKVQKEKGFIHRNAAIKLSKMLDTPLAKIYGVLSFYHFFKLNKPGENIVQVCMGTACYLKGAQDLLNDLNNILGTSDGETSKDGKFSVEPVRCIGCCGLAPVIAVNGDIFGKVTKDQLPEILAKY